ncbi:hypothetical protein ABTZ58_30510 [Streptomyces sp. NPDC094143]|uniref:hypothetical protein n=1 Tax=Streptomyces sp. NPDC094143 TaxID=3155310 RepID=UPI0033178BEE
MSAVKETVDVDCRPEDVYDYCTDTGRLPEWQLSAVSAERLDQGLVGVPPHSWGMRGVDGPVRTRAHGEVEPLDEGRSHVTIAVDFEGHGVGKLLVPLVVRPQVREELPRDEQLPKDRLEHTGG